MAAVIDNVIVFRHPDYCSIFGLRLVPTQRMQRSNGMWMLGGKINI